MPEKLHERITICNTAINLYSHLLNSYVSDFFIEDHWNSKLSNSWKTFLEKASFIQVGEVLNLSRTHIGPLAILCLQEIIRSFSVSREQLNISDHIKINEHFQKLLWKNVKLKKRHEIEIMSKVTQQMALETGCFNIIDIGSGLGHLSRLLAFHYGFNICTFEANSTLVQSAYQLDETFIKMLQLKNIRIENKMPSHNHLHISETLSANIFEMLIRKAFNNYDDNFSFGIVGLHPCGNLGSTLLRLYSECPNAKFINMASCCYMKLYLEPPLEYTGYPLSAFCKKHNYKLDYLSCEMACHAIENFIDKIKSENYCQFKIHSYRAALEYLLVKLDKNMRHSPVGNVKYEKTITFNDYCFKATEKYDLKFDNADIEHCECLIKRDWKKVIKFYSIRLLLAPLVESIILYDRLLFLKENKSDCDILPAFNCRISPRNHIILGKKSA